MTSAQLEPSNLLAAAAPNLDSELRKYVARHRGNLTDLVRRAAVHDGVDASRAARHQYDGMLETLFAAANAVLVRARGPVPAALAAVGSYGRDALALHSDIDLRVLCDGPIETAQQIAETFLYPLWNVGLPVGHQVVRPEDLIELARSDPSTATTLLDWRHLAGDSLLSHRLVEAAFASVFAASAVPDFVQTLEVDTAARHERYGATVYLLEPDLKRGAGGMRDLDVAAWAASARWRVRRLEDLVRVGVLVPREVAQLAAAREHLARVRNQLHLLAGRRSDRLTFDRQEEIAEKLGYGAGAEAAERFMSEHYIHATRITHARELIVGRAIERPRSRRPRTAEVASGLQLFDDKLVFTSSGALARNPSLALHIFHQAVRRNVPVHPTSREAMRRACSLPGFRKSVRDAPQAGALFLALCGVVENTRLWRDSVLGDMHDVGLLATMVPEFEPLVGRVHHDVYHVLTVDVHSIAAVDKLRALARGDDPNDSPLLRRLATEMARPQVLFLAVLLHDVGKAIGRRDHSARGAPIAYDVARRCGLDEEDAAAVGHLVRHHLVMYHAATRRDVDDPQVAREVAQVVAGREALRELLLLTYVDVSTTSPDAMTAWKAALLEQLYLAVDAHLRQDGTSRSERDDYVRSRLETIASASGGEQDVRAFLLSMPERYVLGTDPGRVTMHARLVRDRTPGEVRVALMPARRGAQAEVGIVTDDQPGLLASFAAALAANRLSVLEAQIYSRLRPDGVVEALDLFYVRGTSASTEESLERVAGKLERDLRDVLSGRISADELVRPRMEALAAERPTPHVRTEVVVDNRASANLTVVEAFTQDRPALLYTLARTFRDLGLSIQLAKINTEGTKVADVFYVCEPDGAKVRTEQRAEAIRSHLVDALQRPATEGS